MNCWQARAHRWALAVARRKKEKERKEEEKGRRSHDETTPLYALYARIANPKWRTGRNDGSLNWANG